MLGKGLIEVKMIVALALTILIFVTPNLNVIFFKCSTSTLDVYANFFLIFKAKLKVVEVATTICFLVDFIRPTLVSN